MPAWKRRIALWMPWIVIACGPSAEEGGTPTNAPTDPPSEGTPAPGWTCLEGCEVLHTLDGGERAGGFGWAVAHVADLDGDGITDFMAGSPQNGAGGAYAGALEVFSGATGALLFDFIGETRDFLGWSMADAGDTDGDGISDLLVGAPDASGDTAGRALLFSGATGEELLTWSGEAPADLFGYAVGAAGDIDGDGLADVAVGAPLHDGPAGVDSGTAYVFSGADGAVLRTVGGDQEGAAFGQGVAHVDDLNADGIDELIVGAPGGMGTGMAQVLSGSTGAALFTFLPDPGAIAYGDFFVADVGDVNADGTPDLYVADYAHGGGDGRVYVYSGRDGTRLLRFTGRTGEGLGCGRGAGDVNGDGHADLITGAYTSSEGANNAGKVYVRSGADGSTLREITSQRTGEQLGFDAVGIGDVNGDGTIDLLVSAPPGERVYVIAGAQ